MLGGFVDREAELAALEAAFQQAQTGTPRIVSVEGSPGMGKTALLDAFRAKMQGNPSFLVSGDESEAVLQFGVVSQLLRQFDRYGCTSAELGGRASLEGLDPFRVGAAVLECLGEIQDGGPILLTVEDAHWADWSSLQALTFAFRRLLADRVLVLVSVRDQRLNQLPSGLRRLLEEERGYRISLAGLPAPEVRRLGVLAGWQLSPAAALRLYHHTDGNPLYIKTLLTELEPGALEHGWGRPLPSPRWFHEIVLKRLQHCSEPSREVVQAASVLGVRCSVDRALQLSGLRDPLAALDEAVASGLLILKQAASGPELHFEHPLIRADIYHALPFSKRSILHRTAANLNSDEALSLQHEVAATHGCDPELAARVERFARRQVAKCSWTAAATAFIAAAQLTSDQQVRERCTLDGIDCRLLAGDVAAANLIARDLTEYPSSARRDYIMARLRLVPGATAEARELYQRAWAQLTDDDQRDAGLAARIAGWYAATLELDGRSQDAIDWAQRSLQTGPSDFGRSSFATLVLLLSQVMSGRAADILRTVSELPTDPSAVGWEQCEQLLGRGVARMTSEDLVAARSDLTRSAELAREQGTPYLLTLALGFLSDTEFRLGEWDASVAHGEQATSTAEDSDQMFLAGCTHAIVAFPHIARGAWKEAEEHVLAAEQVAEIAGDAASVSYAAAARARLELMAGRPLLAIGPLEALFELGVEPTEEPGVQPWRLLYSEALCEQGELEAAGLELDKAEARIRNRGLASLLISVGRLRGQLEARSGHVQPALHAFEDALSQAHTVTAPFEVARLELAYGSLLRRLGRRRAAKSALESARNRFLQLRASPFVSRCDSELGATGLKPVRRTVDQRNLLTSQELAVARLVAEGLTNREAAAQLVVSPKTVEYHLVNIFGKLGVKSRTQLVHHFVRQD